MKLIVYNWISQPMTHILLLLMPSNRSLLPLNRFDEDGQHLFQGLKKQTRNYNQRGRPDCHVVAPLKIVQ